MSAARETPVFGRTGGASEQMRGPGPCGDRKERLQDELAELLLRPEEDTDSGRLDALLAALEEIDPAPVDEMLDTEESLKRFHERYASLFPEGREPTAGTSEISPEKKRSRFKLFRFALVAAVLAFMLGSVAAQAFGLNVFSGIARWSSEVFRVQSEEVPYATIRFDPLEEGEEATYDTLEEAIDAFGITAPIVPKEIPERFTLTEVTAANRAGGILICADYECEDGYFQIQYKESTNFNLYGFEREDGYRGVYSCNKINHYLITDMERWKAYWQNGEIECFMSGTVSEQEMKNIIDSIY